MADLPCLYSNVGNGDPPRGDPLYFNLTKQMEKGIREKQYFVPKKTVFWERDSG
jgi:hypothetical protein